MSVPPPPSVAPPAATRETVLHLEGGRSWGRRKGVTGSITVSPLGAVVRHDDFLRMPLQIPLGTLQLGVLDPGPARPGGQIGRFPILKRLTANRVIPREQGIEGWLWTSIGGSGLTTLGDEDDAPNAALLFTKPLGAEALQAFVPRAVEEIVARSPLGAPAVLGLLFRVTELSVAERVFRDYQLLRPLTDREVPPTLRRALPTDQPADPILVANEDARAATSVAPPGMG